jgi:hypothetical protein
MAAEHIGKIDRHIRVIKERSWGIICTLPYMRLLQQTLIHLLHFIVMWLNNFPVSNGVSNQFSPRELILQHKLDYKHHCRAPFGAYCEVHEDNTQVTNSMITHGTPSICLGTTGNIQGLYNILSLSSGLVIKRRRFDKLPAWDSVIKQAAALAKNNGASPNLIFTDCYKSPFDWSDNNPNESQPIQTYTLRCWGC